MNAVLVLDKPAGMTSHDVVNRVRRLTGERSVGHLGTLDPMATGVLPLVLGRYTRLAQFFKDGVKVYDGTISFGFATDTYDAEGEVVGPVCEPSLTLEQIRAELAVFTGRIQQTPPAYSAKKVNGVAAYKLARKDQPAELRAVEVEVHRFVIHELAGNTATFTAEVSAGTYIRSLAHDLGQRLGCGAHLASLRRVQAGEFALSQAVTLEQLQTLCHPQPVPVADGESKLSEYALSDSVNGGNQAPRGPEPFLHPRQFLPQFPSVTASPETVAAIRNGRAVNLPEYSDAPLVKVFANQSLLLAVAQRVAGTLFRPSVVLYGSNEAMPADGRP